MDRKEKRKDSEKAYAGALELMKSAQANNKGLLLLIDDGDDGMEIANVNTSMTTNRLYD